LSLEDEISVPENRDAPSKLTPEKQHQLLSVFFIVACLLGVFFTLGYIVGRSAPFLIGPSTAFAREQEPAPVRESPPAPAPPVRLESALTAQPAHVDGPKTTTPPAADGQSSETYLQLVATSKAGVDAIVDELKQKGFKAKGVPIPGKQGWYRALVGPVDPAAITSTRVELQAVGFPGEQAIARSF
jgi:hypothetical protein